MKIGSVAEIFDGPHATPKPATDGPVFLGIRNITEDGQLDLRAARHISDAEYPRWTRRVTPREGDIVFTYEATLNRYALIPEGFHGCLGRRVALIRPNPDLVDRDYLFYYFFTDEWRELIARNVLRGATVDRIPIERFPSFSISLPPMSVQQRIGSTLRAVDRLIEVNTQRIDVLSGIGRTVFDKWFPYVPLPDGSIDLPKDSNWRVADVGSVLRTLEAGSRPPGGADLVDRDVPSVGAENVLGLGRYDYTREKFVSRSFFDRMRRGKIESGDVVLYKDGAYIGRVSMFRDAFPHEVCCVNEHVFILRTSDHFSQNFLYFWLAHPGITERIRGLSANAAQPGINQPAVRGLPILIPDTASVDRFDQFIEPFVAQIFNLAKTSTVLRTIRDMSLRRLFLISSEPGDGAVRKAS